MAGQTSGRANAPIMASKARKAPGCGSRSGSAPCATAAAAFSPTRARGSSNRAAGPSPTGSSLADPSWSEVRDLRSATTRAPAWRKGRIFREAPPAT
ncbi:hypothetical protein D3C86_1762890 [compost metagenome]